MRKLLWLLLFLLILVMVNADPRYSYRKDDIVDIKEGCYLNGSYCPAATQCNLTMNYPNSTNYAKDINMTRQGIDYNYTMSTTNVAGEYPIKIVCCYEDDCDNDNFTIMIHSAGWLDVSPLIIIIACGIMAFLLFYLSMNLETEHFFLKFFFVSIGLVLIIVVIPASLVAENILLVLYDISRWVFFGFIAYVMLFSIYYVFTRIMGKRHEDEE